MTNPAFCHLCKIKGRELDDLTRRVERIEHTMMTAFAWIALQGILNHHDLEALHAILYPKPPESDKVGE